MTLGSEDIEYLLECATSAALKAGQLIATCRPAVIEHKPGAHNYAAGLVTEIDKKSQDSILQLLEPSIARYDLAVLTEECPDDRQRLVKQYFWCIDPLDGTLPFIEATPGYAVSIALVRRNGTPEIGVIFDPVQQTLYCSARDLGIRRNNQPWTLPGPPSESALNVFTDRSFTEHARNAQITRAMQKIALDMELPTVALLSTGGAVMNACNVLAHPPACYFKFPKPQAGGGSLWDFAATACLFREAGAVATDIYGDSLDLNRVDSTFLNHRGVIFATDRVLAKRIMEVHAHYSTNSTPELI